MPVLPGQERVGADMLGRQPDEGSPAYVHVTVNDTPPGPNTERLYSGQTRVTAGIIRGRVRLAELEIHQTPGAIDQGLTLDTRRDEGTVSIFPPGKWRAPFAGNLVKGECALEMHVRDDWPGYGECRQKSAPLRRRPLNRGHSNLHGKRAKK